MLLSKDTPVNVFNIKVPIWSGRRVGLATFKVGPHNQINITALDKQGDLIYPNAYYISGREARKYPTEPVKSNPKIQLHIIPIDDLDIFERE